MTLLHTNIAISCLKGKEPVTSRFRAASPAEIGIPSVVAYELEYGTLRIASSQRRRLLIAGTAVSIGASLATGNTREFSRIKGLRLMTGPNDRPYSSGTTTEKTSALS